MSLADLQGNVICGYGCSDMAFVFARVRDPDAVRAWLRRRLAAVTWNESWQADPPLWTLNVGLTFAGIRALGVPAARCGGLDAFRAGMAARSTGLGDTGESACSQWQPGLRDAELVIMLGAWTPEGWTAARAELEAEIARPGSGLALTHVQFAHGLPGAREHFGFGDGFSQPAVAGASTGPRAGEGTRTRWGRWRDLALGEFVLGHPDEGGLEPPAPEGPLGRDATFMVVRKLEQDVAAFRRFTRDTARALGRDPEWVAAKLIGRWPNGSSLVRYPDAPGPAAELARDEVNRFRYGEDPHGRACPLGAHVRRANPRDALGWGGRLTQRHRLLRRGISYGDPLPDGEMTGDGRERGLMFVCFQSSIERQFEFIQRQWLGDGNVFGQSSDRDPLLAGSGNGEMVIQSTPPEPPHFLSGIPPFVRTRGGDYFLYPGRDGLEALTAGRA